MNAHWKLKMSNSPELLDFARTGVPIEHPFRNVW